MKQITAIIRPEKISAVNKAVTAVGATGMTITEVKGHGTQKGIRLQSRGGSYEIDFLEKIEIMMVVPDSLVQATIDAIINTARTDRGIGDGKIFVLPVEQAIRIRTGEQDADLL
jgi:nitrogen regulatory protein P-II 1